MNTKQCPQCAEEIKEAAILCKWCQADLRPVDTNRVKTLAKDGEIDPIGQLPKTTQQTIAAGLLILIALCVGWILSIL